MKWMSRHKPLCVLLAALLLVLAMAVASFFTAERSSPLSSAINTLFRPLHTLLGAVSDRFAATANLREEYERLLAENEHLRRLYAGMLDENRQSLAALKENENLRSLLGLELKTRNFVYASATVVNRDLSGYERSLYLSKGEEAGIAVGQCVISADGHLVGLVSQCGAGFSLVTTIIDTTMNLGIKIDRTGQTGVAEGDWELMRRDRLKLGLLPLDADIRIGDEVLTSGLGGVYPADLPIGVISELQTEPTGMNAYAVISPKVDLAALNQLFVVLSYEVTE